MTAPPPPPLPPHHHHHYSPIHRPATAPTAPVPRFGQIRCYWALLVPQYGPKLELQFVYLDPAMSSHLGQQQTALLSHGIIEFIHPGEREQARADLANAIGNDDLQGSVTRMRFARLSRIRGILGCPPHENKVPPDISAVVEDDDYIIVDLVLNWVADGLLLAFFHAIKDKDPMANNDPNRRHEPWSNFCGAVSFGDEAVQTLQQAISTSLSPPPRTRAPPTRVFQLHTSLTTPAHPNSLLFTWPPARSPSASIQVDGLYDAEEYADMMRGVDMDPGRLAAKPGDVRTNCTTRFGAEHSIRTEGVYRHIGSVFIPFGTLIFAAYQTIKCYELPMQTTTESWHTTSAAATAVAVPPPPQPPQAPSIAAAPVPPPGSTLVPPGRDWRSGMGEHDQYAPQTSHYDTASYGPHGYSATHPYDEPPATALASFHGRLASNENTPTPPRASNSSTRPLVRPPGDVDKCRGCGTRESPEWRKGENGIKDLCNACGLKLARAVAKREGRQKPRKKDKL